MANSIITVTARKKMILARAGDILLPRITKFAFGTGGVDSSGSVITPSDTQTTLNTEVYRKDVDGHTVLSDTKCRYECMLEADELAGYSISELGLVDADGDIIAIKNFKAKGKDDDLEMTFQIDDEF